MYWIAVLEDTTAHPDGGPCSFGLATKGRVLREFTYNYPILAYKQLFAR